MATDPSTEEKKVVTYKLGKDRIIGHGGVLTVWSHGEVPQGKGDVVLRERWPVGEAVRASLALTDPKRGRQEIAVRDISCVMVYI